MRSVKIRCIVSATLSAMLIAYGPVAEAVDGDDGSLLLRNVTITPTKLTEFANIQMARFYVPAQNYLGALVPTLNYTKAGQTTPLFARNQAKPLFADYNDGTVFTPSWTNPVTGEVFEPAHPGHGKRDAWTAYSFDDGLTWRRNNLSLSGSVLVGPIFVVEKSGGSDKYVCDATGLTGNQKADLEKNPTKERCDYFYYGDSPETPDPTPRDIDPITGRYVIDSEHLVEENLDGGGDVTMVGQSVVGNHVLVAWISKLCDGTALPTGDVSALNALGTANPYGVKGRQGYTDYALLKAEGEIGTSDLNAIHQIGKVPNSCLWTRRGRIIEDTVTGGTKVQWWAPERLTSGVRDAYKLEVAGHENAGFAVVWQEDPEGLKSGSGEGPGEGWSGSTVNHKTDVWYSFLHLSNFANSGPVMSVPVPITDNAKCPLNSGEQSKQWCYVDNMSYSPATGWTAGSNGLPDYCADGDLVYNSCITEEGRYMEGQTGASRPRINIQPYCKGNDNPDTWATSCTSFSQWGAWAAIAYEESKGKGDLVNEHGVTLETGKNQRFHTFEFTQPEPIRQGLLLNAPAKRYPGFTLESSVYDSSIPGAMPDTVNPGQPVYDDHIVYRPQIFGNSIWSAPLFDTEIARRASITSNGVRAAYNSTSKTTLLTIFKQGLVNQGGPADIMFRRFTLNPGFQPGSDNPFETMSCDRWATAEELGVINNPQLIPELNGLPNPNYLDGLCLASAHNVSATTPTTCDGNATEDLTGVACGYDVTNPNIYSPDAVVKRVFTWTQTQGADSPTSVDNRDDESWTNPWDVAKGHRGIIDGDFVMLQFAWAPNEYANAVGRDAYNLYARRSFDGGQTWTTTPDAAPWTDVAGVVADGASNCETFRVPVDGDTGVPGVTAALPVCASYAAGALEPARDLSLITAKVASTYNYPLRTVLDPRYSPTGGLLKHASSAFKLSGVSLVSQAPYASPGGDIRDPSRYFIAFDDGDNRTVAGGAEAEPINMYYSQGYNWGDEYTGLPVTFSNGATINRFQLLNYTGTNASESSITGNPDGTFMYSIWNQWQYTDPTDYADGSYDSPVINEDAWFRRVMFLNGE